MSPLFKIWLVCALGGLSTAGMAQTPADPAQLEQAQSIGTAIGKPLGMLLFGYVVLRLFNRPRDGEDTGRPWRIGALVLMLLFMLGFWWSR
jgi:Na+/melibiose symporter-like transporter